MRGRSAAGWAGVPCCLGCGGGGGGSGWEGAEEGGRGTETGKTRIVIQDDKGYVRSVCPHGQCPKSSCPPSNPANSTALVTCRTSWPSCYTPLYDGPRSVCRRGGLLLSPWKIVHSRGVSFLVVLFAIISLSVMIEGNPYKSSFGFKSIRAGRM